MFKVRMTRFSCANCQFVFDKDVDLARQQEQFPEARCPKCGSNAVDEITDIIPIPNREKEE